jgi:integral membrane protein
VFNTPVGIVRAAGLVEGVSALVLFFIAMPLKYFPEKGTETAALGSKAVLWIGSIHGGLFVLYAVITFGVWGMGHLTAKLVGWAALASIVPFGPFVIDRKLKAHEDATKAAAPAEPKA